MDADGDIFPTYSVDEVHRLYGHWLHGPGCVPCYFRGGRLGRRVAVVIRTGWTASGDFDVCA